MNAGAMSKCAHGPSPANSRSSSAARIAREARSGAGSWQDSATARRVGFVRRRALLLARGDTGSRSTSNQSARCRLPVCNRSGIASPWTAGHRVVASAWGSGVSGAVATSGHVECLMRRAARSQTSVADFLPCKKCIVRGHAPENPVWRAEIQSEGRRESRF